MGSCEIFVEGVGAARIVEKLAQGGVPVRAAFAEKRGVLVRVDVKHREKVFAILRGSCYNGKKVRFLGASRALRRLKGRPGLIGAALIFLLAVPFFQSRVLRIEVTGSGAYYEQEIVRLLAREGTHVLSAPPADRARITAEILAFPRVSFCTLSHEGGVLTVQVEVSDEAAMLAGGCLIAPAAGVVQSLTVLAGTARAAVGDFVEAGGVLVENVADAGETSLPATVIAAASLRCTADAQYAGSREEALAQAYLEYGPLEGMKIQKTGTAWHITGEYTVRAALNLG